MLDIENTLNMRRSCWLQICSNKLKLDIQLQDFPFRKLNQKYIECSTCTHGWFVECAMDINQFAISQKKNILVRLISERKMKINVDFCFGCQSRSDSIQSCECAARVSRRTYARIFKFMQNYFRIIHNSQLSISVYVKWARLQISAFIFLSAY